MSAQQGANMTQSDNAKIVGSYLFIVIALCGAGAVGQALHVKAEPAEVRYMSHEDSCALYRDLFAVNGHEPPYDGLYADCRD